MNVDHAVQLDHFGRTVLLYGAQTPADPLFKDESEPVANGGAFDTYVSLDRPDGGWTGNVGNVLAFWAKSTQVCTKRTP